LYGTRPLIYSFINSIKVNPPSSESLIPPSSESLIPPSPIVYRSFFSDTVLPQKAIVHNSKLRTQPEIDYYKKKGLLWLRRLETKSYPQILRNPTMGCTLELSSNPTLYTVHIDSKEAKKIIAKECYF
jgi:hypothetical protein